jgi:flagellar hook-length control protein FliK
LTTGKAAADVAVASPPRTPKKGAKGSAGHSSGLIHSPRKGETAFSRLVSAQAGKKILLGVSQPAVAQLDPVQALKGVLAAAVKATHEKNGTGAPGLPSAAIAALSSGQHSAKAGETLGNGEKAGEKTDGKKKPVHQHAPAVALAIVAPAPAAKPGQPSVKEEQPTAQALAVGPRAAAAQVAAPKVLVVDLRRKTAGASTGDAGPLAAQGAGSEKPSATTLLVRAAGGHETGFDPSAKTSPAAPLEHATPVERLRELAGTELLRASTMVLRDGGGEIRLVLKPESLGSVRIRMNVTDNSIDGKIIVDSAAVKQVFDGNIDALKRALTAEGFQMGSLQVSVGGQGAFEDRQGQEREKPAAVRRVAAEDFQRNIPGVENLSLGELMVNLFV